MAGLVLLALLALAAGWWLLGSEAAGGLATGRGLDRALPAGSAALEGGPSLETVAGGVARDGAPTGALQVRLPGPGRLEGRVRNRGADGAPVPRVTVRLLPVPPVGDAFGPTVARFLGHGDDLGRRAREIARTRSDEDGRFAFEGVREGRWFLDVVAPNVRVEGAPRAYVRASGSGGPVDVWVRGAGRVVGRVEDADGAPVAGADVGLGTGAMRMLEAAGDGDVAYVRGTTDAEGRFVLEGLPPAEGYELSALGPGIAITHVTGITVEAAVDTEVVVRGRRPAEIEGRLLSRGAEGAEAPLAGARVAALPRGLRSVKFARELLARTHDITDADGRYTLSGVPPGECDVLAMADEHLPGRGPVVHVAAAGAITAPDFALDRGPVVRGTVVDAATGAPVAGARVLWTLIDFDEIEGQPSLAPLVLGAMEGFEYPVTGADGRFEAGPFPKDPPFDLRVLAPGYAHGRAAWDPEAGPEVVIALERAGSIQGEVVDAATGEPVRTFEVVTPALVESNPEAPSTLNPFAGGLPFESEDGTFRLDSVAPGPVTLEFLADGYRTASVDVAVAPSAPSVVRVVLDPGGTIFGAVTDAEGTPVGGAQVTTEALLKTSFARMEALRPGIEDRLAIRGEPRRPTPPVGFLRYAAALGFVERGVVTTAGDGTFELSGLEGGRHEVVVMHRDFELASATVTLPDTPGARAEARIELNGGATVFGTLTDRHGRPIADGTVVLASPGLMAGARGGDLRQSRTREDGSYAIDHLSGGPYVVASAHADAELGISSLVGSLELGFVFVPEGGRVEHDVVDASSGGCRVTGSVSRDGVPVTDGLLVASLEGGGGLFGLDFKVAPIERDGTYAFEGLEPGGYRFVYEERGQRRRGRVGEGRGGTVEVEVPDAASLVVHVELPAGAIEGRVVAGDDGEPLGDVRVVVQPAERAGAGRQRLFGVDLSDASRARIARTDANGRFVVPDLADGAYVVEVERTRVRREGQAVELMAPEPLRTEVSGERTTEVGDVVLEAGLSLDGRVMDDLGAPIEDARVLATWAGSAGSVQSARARSNEDGAFTLRGLRPGPWRLRVSADGYASPAPREVTASDPPAGEPPVLVLTGGVETVLEVFDGATGAPRAGVAVALSRAGESDADAAAAGDFLRRYFQGEAVTDADGRLSLGRLERGASYVLELSAAGRISRSTLDVPATGPGRETVRRAIE